MNNRWLSVCGLVVAVGCSQHECDLKDDMRLFAGDGAIDCGTAGDGKQRSEVDQCATDAFEAHQAFFARYQSTGTDSKLVVGVASNTEGAVKIFRWDSAPCGGPGCDPVTDVQTCEEPSVLPQTSDDPNALPLDCKTLGTPQRICST